MGGALVGAALQSGCGSNQEQAMDAPNLNPPVVQVAGGKLRGFRDGSTYTFLGIPYAEADRFELPKPVQPWDDVKSAQVWGPVCPAPPVDTVSGDELVFPHRYWRENGERVSITRRLLRNWRTESNT